MRYLPMPTWKSWVLLSFTTAGLALSAPNGPAAFVAGDLMVKFTDASPAGMLVSRAMQGDPGAERQLPDLAARLSAEIGVKLLAARVTSGRELVLGVDLEALEASLAERCQRDREVTRVLPLPAPKTVLPPATLALAVEFAPNSDAKRLLERAARAGERAGGEIDALAARLSAGADPRPTSHVNERGQLVLTLDIAALTLQLVERFKRRSDVEYAQIIQIVRPFPGSRLEPN